MNNYKKLFLFLIAVLLISYLSFVKHDIVRLFEIESQADTIHFQNLSIDELESELNVLEIQLKVKGNNIQLLLKKIEILKKIIEHERNNKNNDDFIILDSLSIDTSADGNIIKISK